MFINASSISHTFILKTLLSYVDKVNIVVDICTLDANTMKPCKYEFRGNKMDVDRVNIKGIQGALDDVEIDRYYIAECNNKRVFNVYTKRLYKIV